MTDKIRNHATQARAVIDALHAHGYKITKDDPDMLSIPEVSTDRPIGR